ncbi:response regulator [Halioxenophilus sp. WMMB6]|uniref:response regulator n=1 Tax=Halioxenophilus sp. WMMB6 TaxID=3073815 RepID=UPI00295EDD72|nr:response regulator [Halioxenophilus sp. WMMB6]
MNNKVLLVEDEESLAEVMQAFLQRDSFDVEWVADGGAVLAAFERLAPDLVLLDLMLPSVDGLTLCREIRARSQVPIIMVTARIDEIDRLLGLEIGADDYICKPYSPREVVARCKAVLRRYQAMSPLAQALPDNANSPLTLDQATLDGYWSGQALALTAVEFRLLYTMAQEPRRIFSREQLMSNIYNDHRVVNDRTIDSHITKLRRKLAAVDSEQEVIRSVYGVGYKFELPL